MIPDELEGAVLGWAIAATAWGVYFTCVAFHLQNVIDRAARMISEALGDD